MFCVFLYFMQKTYIYKTHHNVTFIWRDQVIPRRRLLIHAEEVGSSGIVRRGLLFKECSSWWIILWQCFSLLGCSTSQWKVDEPPNGSFICPNLAKLSSSPRCVWKVSFKWIYYSPTFLFCCVSILPDIQDNVISWNIWEAVKIKVRDNL